MYRISRVAVLIALLASASACALSRSPRIADLKMNPGRYQNHSVNIEGVVTTSWGAALSPFKMYKVDDGTGEVTVLSSQASRLPTRGAHVRVRGRVDEVAVLGGQAVGLHLREQSVHVKR
jgi:hypothetical protein